MCLLINLLWPSDAIRSLDYLILVMVIPIDVPAPWKAIFIFKWGSDFREVSSPAGANMWPRPIGHGQRTGGDHQLWWGRRGADVREMDWTKKPVTCKYYQLLTTKDRVKNELKNLSRYCQISWYIRAGSDEVLLNFWLQHSPANQGNTIPADDLAPRLTRSSAVMILTVKGT